MKKNFIVMLMTFIMSSCYKKEEINDFSFILEQNISTIINEKNNFFMVRYADKNDTTLSLNLTNNEKAQIKNMFVNESLYNLPDIYEPKSDCTEMPEISSRLTVFYNNKKKVFKIVLCDSYSFFEQTKLDKVNNHIKLIKQITYSKSHIKALPKSNIMYL